ncbi:MAG: radical SAM protein [Candidatus Pacebacteria bacterium]|nr:radical SAM protein [Candidatus Paceibacterota bacterium]
MSRFLNFSKNILVSNFTRSDRPYKLTLALTDRCNSRCRLCRIWQKKFQREMGLAEISRFFRENDFFNWIDLTGGEVFLREDLLEIIKVILLTQKKLYFLHLPTNGRLSNKIETAIREILALGPPRLIISIALDGPPEIHDRLRGVKGSWREAVRTYQLLQKIKSKRFNCCFGMTLWGKNAHLIEKTYRALKKEIPALRKKELHFNLAHRSEHYYANSRVDLGLNKTLVKNLNEFRKCQGFSFKPFFFIEALYQKGIGDYLKNGRPPLPCRALAASVFIDPRGEIFPCSIWNNPIGNLAQINYDLKRFWQTPKVLKVRRQANKLKCPGCWTPCEAYQSILGNLKKSFF